MPIMINESKESIKRNERFEISTCRLSEKVTKSSTCLPLLADLNKIHAAGSRANIPLIDRKQGHKLATMEANLITVEIIKSEVMKTFRKIKY